MSDEAFDKQLEDGSELPSSSVPSGPTTLPHSAATPTSALIGCSSSYVATTRAWRPSARPLVFEILEAQSPSGLATHPNMLSSLSFILSVLFPSSSSSGFPTVDHH